MEPAEIEKLIAEGFLNPTVRVASDDNHHFEALVVAEEFEGKRALRKVPYLDQYCSTFTSQI